MVKYSIIIPTLNEEEGIAKVLCGIPEKITKDAEIIVVDASSDMTPVIAKKLGARLLRPWKKGKGYAMKAGVNASKGDIIIFLDGDGTDPPQYIPKLLKKLEKYDIVLGSRSLQGEGTTFYRGFFRLYFSVAQPIFKRAGLVLSGDPLAGFRVMRREIWNKLNLKSNDFLIETEMNLAAVKLGLKIGEVHIPHIKRAGGLFKSKLVHQPDQWIKILDYLNNFTKSH